MSKKLECPCCGSKRVYSHDNQFLWHPDDGWSDNEIEDSTPQHDDEIYVSFNCHNCSSSFDVIFDLKPQRYWSVSPADAELNYQYTKRLAQGKCEMIEGDL